MVEEEKEELIASSPVEEIVQKEYGKTGLHVFKLLDGKKTPSQIMQQAGLNMPKLIEVLNFMEGSELIKLAIPAKQLSKHNSIEVVVAPRVATWLKSSKKFESAVKSKYGKEGVKTLAYIDGKRSLNEIISESSYPEAKVLSVIKFCKESITRESLQFLDPLGKSEEFSRLFKSAMENPSKYWYYSKVYLKQKDFWALLNKLNTKIKRNPKNVKALYRRGLCHLLSWNCKAAKEDFAKASEIRPDFPEALRVRGLAYELLGYPELAVRDYNCYLAFADDPKVREFVLFHSKKRSNNSNDFSFPIVEKQNKFKFLEKAFSFLSQGLFNDVLREATKCIKTNPDCAPAYNLRAVVYYHRQDFKAAIKDLSTAIELEPYYAEAIYNRGLSHSSLEKYGEAIADCSKVIRLKPELAKAFHLRGIAHEFSAHLKEAIVDYKKSIELNPDLRTIETRLDSVKNKLSQQTFTPAEEVSPSLLVSKPQITLDDVGGMKELKDKLRSEGERLIDERLAKLAEEYGLESSGGILLVGPPGIGKTHIVEALAGEMNCKYIRIKISAVLSRWSGLAEKNITATFEYARRNQPCIIFFDEVEALGGNREDMKAHWEVTLINQFLTEMDSIWRDKEKILVIGATNAPWRVDAALTRSGRFGKTVFVKPPDLTAREEIFEIYTSKIRLKSNIDCKKLAELTEGFSGANIAFLCREAAERKYKESVKKNKKMKVCMEDFQTSIEDMKKTKTDVQRWLEILEKHESKAESHGGFRSPEGMFR